jgi:hypothetical protein
LLHSRFTRFTGFTAREAAASIGGTIARFLLALYLRFTHALLSLQAKEKIAAAVKVAILKRHVVSALK